MFASYLTNLIAGSSGGCGHIDTNVGEMLVGSHFRTPEYMMSWDWYV